MSVAQSTTFARRVRTNVEFGAARWKQFWFEPEDAFTLGIIRFLTGWMLAYNLLVWGLDLDAFFSSDGLQPLSTIREFHGRDFIFSFLFYVSDEWLHPVHWTAFAIALLFCCGVCTRVTSVLAFLITISYSHRVPVANFGLDQILGMLCLYLAIGPSGAALSVDQWLRNRRIRKADPSIKLLPVKLESCRMALRLIQIHLCIIYFWAGFAKLKGDSWWTGEALWQVMANQEYQTLDLTWMAWVPWLPYLIAHVTVAWEVFFCVLIWNKYLRPIMLAIGTGMHFGIGAFLGMWTFGLVMTYAYFAFSSPQIWRRRLHWLLPRVFSEPDDFTAVSQSDGVVSTANVKADLQKPQGESPELIESDTEPEQFEVTVGKFEDASPAEAVIDSVESVAVGLELVSTGFSESESETETQQEPRHASALSASEVLPELADEVLQRDTSVLLVAAHAIERATLRYYFRRHDIPCKAASNPATAFEMIPKLDPVVIVVSGARFKAIEMATMIEDFADAADVPILAVVSKSQRSRLLELDTPARLLQYPSTPREIRIALSNMLFGNEGTDGCPELEHPGDAAAVRKISEGQ